VQPRPVESARCEAKAATTLRCRCGSAKAVICKLGVNGASRRLRPIATTAHFGWRCFCAKVRRCLPIYRRSRQSAAITLAGTLPVGDGSPITADCLWRGRCHRTSGSPERHGQSRAQDADQPFRLERTACRKGSIILEFRNHHAEVRRPPSASCLMHMCGGRAGQGSTPVERPLRTGFGAVNASVCRTAIKRRRRCRRESPNPVLRVEIVLGFPVSFFSETP